MSSPSPWACFHPLSPLSVVSASKEISVWNAETQHKCTRFKSNYGSCTGKSSENIYRRLGRRKYRMKLNLPPKLVERLVWVPVSLLCKKISFPITCLMPYYVATGHFHPLIIKLYNNFSVTTSKANFTRKIGFYWPNTIIDLYGDI